MGIFGWSYPAGCSGPPDDYYDEPQQPRCGQCQAYLPHEPQMRARHDFTAIDYRETGRYDADGWPEFEEFEYQDSDIAYAWVCKRCGHLHVTYDY